MKRKITHTVLVIVALLALTEIGQAADTAWTNLTTPPFDSADAKNCRIWYQVKHSQPCRVSADILDKSGKPTRALFSKLLTAGYYNFYWDKRDDSGRFVEAGEYHYRIRDCGQIKTGKVIATFKKWELLSTLYPAKLDSTFVTVELLADSAVVSIVVFNKRGEKVARPIVDTLLNSGRHDLWWNNRSELNRGEYLLEIMVGDFVYHRKKRIR